MIEKIFGYNAVINYGDYFGPAADSRMAISNLLLVTRKSYNYFETMVATIYSLGTIIQLQFLFALFALIYHMVYSETVDLQVSDSFKILYLIWFILDTIQLYSVKYKYIRAIGFMVLVFGTFTLWRLYGFPVIMRTLL